MATLLTMLPKILLSLGMKLLSEKLIEELLIWGIGKLAGMTKTKVDDEIYEMVVKHLDKKHKETSDA